MIDVREHVYQDDPKVGHPDVRTELGNVDYFFLGNGLIQAAVQAAPAGDGTPVGLLLMNPDRLRKKREALSMDVSSGLEPTMVKVGQGGQIYSPHPGAFKARWSKTSEVPTVVVTWKAGPIRVEESFFCPSWDTPALDREVVLKNAGRTRTAVRVETGVKKDAVGRVITLTAGEKKKVIFRYLLDPLGDAITLSCLTRPAKNASARTFWNGLAEVSFGDSRLDHFFRASIYQLPVAVSRAGCADGGIWQYNREWLRDQAMVGLALTMAGACDPARTMFTRLLERFVSPEGDTVDSSERRHPDEVELDQNGFLLYTLKDYALWTGDLDIVRDYWPKIVAAAEFPLQGQFRHKDSGLLANRREFWERHRAHGIEPGLELVHQLYTSHGLAAGATLARLTGHSAEASRWEEESRRLKKAMLENPRFRMADNRGFIKRRGLDGRVQEKIVAGPDSGLPPAAPLARPGDHFLNPDTSAALPIALGFVPPDSPLCRLTMASLETLWNQEWTGGGYGRYHASSEPDSPGGWPFPSLFAARASVELGEDKNVWRILNWLASVPGARAGTWFEFYGKRLAPPFPQVGIVPWNWAEMIILVVHHILGIRPGELGLFVRPRLLSGINRAVATFPMRGTQLRLDLRKGAKSVRPDFATNGRVLRSGPDGILLGYGRRPISVKAKVVPAK
jgi:hypothetical protein